MTKNYYKLRHLIPNCDKKLLQITAILLQIAAKNFTISSKIYYKSRQLKFTQIIEEYYKLH